MPRKEDRIDLNFKARPRKKSAGKSGFRRFCRLLITTPLRQIILIAIILILLFAFRERILAIGAYLVSSFGWGLLFMAVALGILIERIWRRRISSLFRYRWLGVIALILAAWGILAFFNLGGSFGLLIIGQPPPNAPNTFLGVLCILGFVIIGTILIAPRASLHLADSFFLWLGRRWAKRPARKPVSKETPLEQLARLRPVFNEKPALPSEAAGLTALPELGNRKKPAAAPTKEAGPAAPSSKEDLRQVAQEVWKKYGQSSGLVVIDGWRLPPLDILEESPEIEFSQADNVQRAKLIEEAMGSYGVEAKVVQINAGPTVTQFGLEPGWDRKYKDVKEKDKDGNVTVTQKETSRTRVKVERITSLSNDLALALAAPSIRIEAPIPGKSVVGVEVPNTISGMVSLRGVVETSAFQKSLAKSRLTVALGKGAGGEAVAADLTKMPHLLVAGATGSGKTVCLNTIICCLLLHNTPLDVRFILIDPKRVEMTQYNGIPHLAIPVIVESDRALSALRWLNQEMGERYKKLAAVSARNIEGYNKNKEGAERLPYLVLVIDELADLMMTGFDEVETTLCRLAQLSRAVGIHLIVATQRPSVDVVTGLIKANFPTRISFAVTSQVDSRTILDTGGAEKLLGKGDMLYMPTEAAKPKRLQGSFLSDAEVERLVYFWSSQQPEQEPDKLKIEGLTLPTTTTDEGYPKDPLLATAKELSRDHEHISTSFLQRRLHIGYPRAARLMEQLEEELKKESGEGESQPS